jgi:ribosomal protein L37AE/L43A
MLDLEARQVWKHWIGQANGGKGLGAVCPNITPQTKICPIDLKYADLPKDNEERKANNARRKFVINVLDRTPHTICKFCQTQTPGITQVGSTVKSCISCGADLKGHDFKPLNRIKILEQGPKLFNEQLNVIQEMQKSDIGKDITEYDITFTTQGERREKRITAIPQDPKELEPDALLDPETGEPQKRYDLDLLVEPTSVEEIELMLEGATMDQLNAVRGIV